MAVESTQLEVGLREPAQPVKRPAVSASSQLAARISRHLAIAVPTINLISAAATYTFIEFVVPLPGRAEPAAARSVALAGSLAVTSLAWLACDLWGRHAFAPVRRWLERGGEPDEAERTRTIRLPLHGAGHVLVMWTLAGAGFGVFESRSGAR